MQWVLAAKSAVGFVMNQIAGLAKALKFDATAVTFTPCVAKRCRRGRLRRHRWCRVRRWMPA